MNETDDQCDLVMNFIAVLIKRQFENLQSKQQTPAKIIIMKDFKKAIRYCALCLVVSLVAWIASSPSQSLVSLYSQRNLQTYLTSTTRMQIVQSFCKGREHTSKITSEDISLNKQYIKLVNTSFSVDGNQLINELSNDWSKAPQKLKEQTTGFLLFAGPFAIAFALLLLLLPFLSCCCCCPNKCPSACCRIPDNQLYSKCELKWPAIVAMISLMLAVSAGIYGMIKAPSVTNAISSISCSIAVVPDDLLNGNVTADGQKFFTGLNMLYQSLSWFDGNLTSINNILTKFDSTNSNMTTAIADGYVLTNSTKNIDGNSGNGMSTLTYGPPISENSQFKSILGTYNTSGLIYDFFTLNSEIINSLISLGTNVHTYFQSAGTISSSISTARSQISNLISKIQSVDTETYKYTNISNQIDKTSLYLQIFYAVVIGLSALGILGALLMCCCNKQRCRYLMYFSCFFLSFIALAGLLIATLFSVILPPMDWGCQFLMTSLSSSISFSRNFRGIDATTQSYLKTCMPFGDGNIVAKFQNNLDSLNNLTDAFSFLQDVDFASLNTSITNGKNSFLSSVNAYAVSQKSDISSSAISTLATYADASNFASCTNPNFALDSYVPSINQNPVYVDCTVSTNSANFASCSGNFNPKGGSCYGCLDISSIFANYPSGAQVTTDINGRYGNLAGCNSFATNLGNLWTNYYNPKQTTIGSSAKPGGIYTSVNSLNIATFQGDLATLNGALTGVTASINSLNSILDPNYGMLGGLNCNIFGQDFQNIVNTTCILGFNAISNLRLTVGICSFGLFFMSFCAVCAGSRYARQGDKRKSKVENSSQDEKQGRGKKKQTYILEHTLQTLRRK